MLKLNAGVLRQYAAAMAAGLSCFTIGLWIGWPSPAVKEILSGETNLDIHPSEVSWAVALLDIGNVVSPIPSSFISDWIGRKLTLILLSFALFISWLLTVFATNAWYLYAARTIAGLCKGLAFTVVPIYLGEIASANVRGGVGTIFCSMMNYGILFILVIGSFVRYEILNIIATPFPVLFLLCFFRLPESPYFLIMKGRTDEAKMSLSWFRSLDENSPMLEQELKQISVNVEEDLKQHGSFKDLINSTSARKAMFISLGFALLQRLSGMSSIIAYSSITLPPTGGYFSPEVYMIFFGVTAIIGQSICGVLVDKLGRKPLLITSCAGCAASTGISALFYWLDQYYDVNYYNWVPYFCVILYSITFAIGLGTIPSVITAELFSSDVRSFAASVAAIFYAIGSFITNKSFLYVKMNMGVHFMYIFFTVCSLLCILLTCRVYFETKGKTFLEIQYILKYGKAADTDITESKPPESKV